MTYNVFGGTLNLAQFNLVPAHPSNPRQSQEGHKMDVCVCVLNYRIDLVSLNK